MAFKLKNGTTLGVIYGDRGYGQVKLYDSKAYSRGNGVHVSFGTQAERETFVAGIEPLLDGMVSNISSEHGNYKDEAKVRTNDTYGDSSTKVFTVKFTDSADTCNIVVNQVLNNKVSELGALLKGQSYMAADGVTALTVGSVEVKTVI